MHEDTGDSYLAASHNLPPALAENPRVMEGDCYCLSTYRLGDLEGAPNVKCGPVQPTQRPGGRHRWSKIHSSVPLGDKRVEVLNVASTDWRELSEDDLSILYTVGDLVGIAVERSRLFSRSAELGAMEERNRLAREIHDTLAQGLAAIVLRLETAEAHLDGNSDLGQVRQAVHQALELSQDSLQETRRSVLDLRPAPLAGRTLPEALSRLSEGLSGTEGLKVKFQSSGRPRPLASRIAAGLFRVPRRP